jgi:hypothetical protein
LSELISLVQTILNIHGLELHYSNLISFWILSIFYIFELKVKKENILCICFFGTFIILKLLFLEIGIYYLKVIILLGTIPLYFIIFNNTNLKLIEYYCEKYLLLFLLLGLAVLTSWILVGEYRNTSTFTCLIVAIICSRKLKAKIFSIPFFLTMKTQYQLWLLTTILLKIFRLLSSRLSLFLVIMFCILLPYTLYLYLDNISFLGTSHLTSLGERLEETKYIYDNISMMGSEFWYGANIGTSIYLEANDSHRGYTHSLYLWVILYFGIPLTLIFIILFISTKNPSSNRHMFIINLLLLSNCFTFLLFTNPFTTCLLLANNNEN